MPLNASGPISIGGSTVGQSINLELGRAGTAQSNLNETALRTLANVLSGAISMSNFYGKSGVAVPGETWTNRLYGVTYNGITYSSALGLYVAVGDQGIIQTSPNGTTWTFRTSGVYGLSQAAWSPALARFVVVGNSGTILTSSDGITWTSQTSGTANQLRGVTWSVTFSMFIAVGASGTILTSPDGITWTARTSPLNQQFNAVAAGGGFSLYIMAVGNSGACIVSSDGITWTTQATGIGNSYNDVIYVNSYSSNGLWILVGTGGAIRTFGGTLGTATGRTSGVGSVTITSICLAGGVSTAIVTVSGLISTSTDGITWTSRTSPTNTSLNKIGTDGFNLVIVGTNGQVVGGFGSTYNVLVSGAVLNDVAYNPTGTVHVAVGSQSSILRSTNGINWTVISHAGGGVEYTGVAYSPALNLWALVGLPIIRTSPDGITWTSQSSVNNLNKVTWDGTRFVAVGSAGVVVTSTNGSSWATQTSGTPNGLNGIVSNGSLLVATGATGAILTSTNGSTWTTRIPALPLRSVAYSSSLGLYVAVGGSGIIQTSTDGVNWTPRNSGVAGTHNQIIWTGSLFAVASAVGNVLTSTDGVNWTVRYTGIANNLNSIAFNGSLYVVVGLSGTIRTSPDTITWTSQTSGTTNTLNTVIWGNNEFVAGGNTGTVRYSVTGTGTWTTITYGVTSSITSIVYTGQRYVSVGASGHIRTSQDAITWTAQTSGTANTFNSIAWSGSRLIAVGANNAIRNCFSSFGDNWTAVTVTQPATDYSVGHNGVSWINNGFMIVSNDGNVFTSDSIGTTWTHTVQNTVLRQCVWTGSQFITVGNLGYIKTSSDGVTWTRSAAPITASGSNTLWTIAWSGTSLAVGGGTAGTILTSPDGTTWTSRTTNTSGRIISDILWAGDKFVGTMYNNVAGIGHIITSP